MQSRVLAIAVVLTLALALPGKSSTVQFVWPWIVVYQGLLLLPFLLFAWALSSAKWPDGWGRMSLLCSVVACVPLISAFDAAQMRFAVGAALPLAVLPLWMALFAFHLAGEEDAPWLNVRTVGVAASAPLVASLAWWLPELFESFGQEGGIADFLTGKGPRNAHPFGHWNHLAGYCLLVLPLLLDGWRRSRSIEGQPGRWGWVVGILLAAFLLFTSQSRGALLGAFVGSAVWLALSFRLGWIQGRSKLMLVGGAVVVLIALSLLNPRIRGLALGGGGELSEGDVQRVAMLEASRTLIPEGGFFGHGPGRVPFVYPTARGAVDGGVETAFQLHSLPVQLAAELGLAGCLVLLAALVLAFVVGVKRVLAPAPNSTFAVGTAVASICGLTGYGIFSLTDHQLEVPAIGLLVAWHAGVLLAHGRLGQLTERSKVLGMMRAFVVLTLAACLAWLLLGTWRSRSALAEGFRFQASGQLLEARVQFERAVALAPGVVHPLNRLGFQLALEAASSADSVQRELLRSHALEVFASSLAVEPAQEPIRAARGWLLLESAPAAAEAEFREALRLLPGRDSSLIGLGFALHAQGREVVAARVMALACVAQPMFVLSPRWRDPELALLHQRVIDRLPGAFSRVEQVNQGRALEFVRGARHVLGAALGFPEGGPAGYPEQREVAAALMNGLRAAAVEARMQPGPERDRVTATVAAKRAQGAGDTAREQVRTPLPQGIPPFVRMVERRHYALMVRVPEDPGYPDLFAREADPFTQAFLGSALTPPKFSPPKVPVSLAE